MSEAYCIKSAGYKAMVCSGCVMAGHCRRRNILVLSEAETKDSVLVRLVRNRGRKLFIHEGLGALGVRDYISDKYKTLDVRIIDRRGQEYFLPTEILDPPDWVIDEGEGENFDEALRKYIERNFFIPLPAHKIPRVSGKHRDWFVLIATFIMAVCNEESASWPRHFAANDNHLYPPIAANDNLPAEIRI